MENIQVILDSLDLKKEKYNEKRDKYQRRGGFKFSLPVQPRRTSYLEKSVRARSYVSYLIPHNINDIEFIYQVNFEVGKGQNDKYSLGSFLEIIFLHFD